MAGGFLHKLFGASPSSPPEVQSALTELEQLSQQRQELAGPVALLAEILPNLYREPVRETAPTIAPDHAAAKLGGAVPLLRGESLHVDHKSFGSRWQEVCQAIERRQGGDAGRLLATALTENHLDPVQMTTETLAGRADAIHARADDLGLDAGLTATVLRMTLFPVLAHVSAALAPLRQGTPWNQGYCPTCGSWPLLGEFRGLEQTRFLRCGLCAAEWELPRLMCPFCGTRDHHLLGYFHVEGEEGKYRASTCDECQGYVKMLSTLTAISEPGLLVAELATMHLDLAAAERGYLAQP